MLDLDYAEDSTADADANFVLTAAGGIVEVQATAEGDPFSEAQLIAMLGLARSGTEQTVRPAAGRPRRGGLRGAMARRLAAARLIVASHNAGKAREIAALLRPLGIEAVGAAALGLAEPEETGDTFGANAALKARAAAAASGEPALADDSGLVVPALDGAPGIYSARWAGPGKDFRVAMGRIETELAARGSQTVGAAAYFVCALALGWPDGHCETVEGRVDGTLAFPPRGRHGFGYDPIFVPDGHARSFGEMVPEEKQPLTHRARAFAQLAAALRPARP